MNGGNSSNNVNGLPMNLDMNLSLDSLDHQQVPLRNTRRRYSPDINGNLQSHLLQPTNYFMQNPNHDPVAITTGARLSTMTSPLIQTNSPSMMWPQPQQPIHDQNPIPVHHFSPIDYNEFSYPNQNQLPLHMSVNQNQPSPHSVDQELQSYLAWQQTQNYNQNQSPPPSFNLGYFNPQYLESYLDWTRAQNYTLQIMNNYIVRASTGTNSRPIAPAAVTRLSSSRRNSRNNNNNNASNVPAIYQHRSITTGRRRRNMLVSSMFESNAPAAAAATATATATAIVFGENFITPDNFYNMMTHEEISISPMREEVDHETGLNEGEIMMSVHRLRHCHYLLSEHEGEEEFNQEEDDICKLSCNHIYHFECIKTWLMQKNFCPICKTPAMFF
ncbi:probable E3 ubiquitin-protein ligase RHG1A [Impatiens glandulifera]|uniref:probable E3 ubiquitin-protein ligase RHG1A n=1 Tax=Impatiens glandulifera TaxID=253017 RepID=UPI001FB17C12|nr:probable E3 ubiquitin-protein ligase RHG1A [Impatiens glandulifera]